MNEQVDMKPTRQLTATLGVRGPELTGLLADLRGHGVILLTVSIIGQNHYSVTYQKTKTSTGKPTVRK